MNNAEKPAHPDNFDGHLNGLTKREYFAAMAMQGILSGHFASNSHDALSGGDITKGAVAMADRLLKELEK